jgi:hypothetical protein
MIPSVDSGDLALVRLAGMSLTNVAKRYGLSRASVGSSEAAAWREVGRLSLDINIDQSNGSQPIFRVLAEHFRQHELKKEHGIGVKARAFLH